MNQILINTNRVMLRIIQFANMSDASARVRSSSVQLYRRCGSARAWIQGLI